MDEYDLLICGAGPAGSFLGKLCSDAGIRTIIIDGRQEIGVPLYAGELVDLSSFSKVLPIQRDMVNFFPIDRIQYFLTDSEGKGNPINFFPDMEGSSGTLDREKLDKEMAALAALSGADIRIRTRMAGWERTESNIRARLIRDGRIDEISSRMIIRADGPDQNKIQNSKGISVVSGRIFSSDTYESQIFMGLNSNRGFKMDLQKGDGFRNLILKGEQLDLDSYKRSGWTGIHEMSFSFIFPPVPLGDPEVNIGSRCMGPEPFFLSGLHLSMQTANLALNYAKDVMNGAELEVAGETYRKSIEILSGQLARSMKLHDLLQKMNAVQVEKLQNYLGGSEIHGFSSDSLLRDAGLSIEKITEEFR